MEARGVDAAVIASRGNFAYLSGYDTQSWENRARPLCLVVGRSAPALAIVGASEAARACEGGVDVEARPYADPEPVRGSLGAFELEFMRSAAKAIRGALDDLGARVVGWERSSHFLPGLSPAALETLTADGEAVDLSPELWRLRRRKSPHEVDHLRVAAAVLGDAFTCFEQVARPGFSERELHRLFVGAATEAGADRVPYTAVIAGLDTSLGGATERRWQRGQLLTVDAGIVVDSYWADFCRIYAAEPLGACSVSAHQRLADALARGRGAARPGAPASAVAAAMWHGAETDSFGRMGHGVGLDLTEPPSLHPADITILEPGMTLCLEPNWHVAGVGHLAAEEEIVITETGAELLSPPFPDMPAVVG